MQRRPGHLLSAMEGLHLLGSLGLIGIENPYLYGIQGRLCLLGINSVLGGSGEETDVLTEGRKVSRGMEIQLGVERRQLLLIPNGWVTP